MERFWKEARLVKVCKWYHLRDFESFVEIIGKIIGSVTNTPSTPRGKRWKNLNISASEIWIRKGVESTAYSLEYIYFQVLFCTALYRDFIFSAIIHWSLNAIQFNDSGKNESFRPSTSLRWNFYASHLNFIKSQEHFLILSVDVRWMWRKKEKQIRALHKQRQYI